MSFWENFFRGSDLQLYRTSENPVGLSTKGGEPITRAEDLPAHLVTVHLFHDANMAFGFVSGLQATRLGNDMAYLWEHGDLTANRMVLVADFSEDRPAGTTAVETLPRITYGATGIDGKTIAEHEARRQERDREIYARMKAFQQPFRDAMKEAGCLHFHGADGWINCTFERHGYTVTYERNKPPFRVQGGISDLLHCNVDLTETIAIVANAHGVAFDPEDKCFWLEADTPGNVAVAVQTIAAAVRDGYAARKRSYERLFREQMKLTRPRRRFLEAARDAGIHRYFRRGNLRLKAGGEDIGQTEIDKLLRIRWIVEESATTYVITDEGIAALSA